MCKLCISYVVQEFDTVSESPPFPEVVSEMQLTDPRIKSKVEEKRGKKTLNTSGGFQFDTSKAWPIATERKIVWEKEDLGEKGKETKSEKETEEDKGSDKENREEEKEHEREKGKDKEKNKNENNEKEKEKEDRTECEKKKENKDDENEGEGGDEETSTTSDNGKEKPKVDKDTDIPIAQRDELLEGRDENKAEKETPMMEESHDDMVQDKKGTSEEAKENRLPTEAGTVERPSRWDRPPSPTRAGRSPSRSPSPVRERYRSPIRARSDETPQEGSVVKTENEQKEAERKEEKPEEPEKMFVFGGGGGIEEATTPLVEDTVNVKLDYSAAPAIQGFSLDFLQNVKVKDKKKKKKEGRDEEEEEEEEEELQEEESNDLQPQTTETTAIAEKEKEKEGEAVETLHRADGPKKSPGLMDNMRNFIDSKKYSDVTFIVEGLEVQAHKVISISIIGCNKK